MDLFAIKYDKNNSQSDLNITFSIIKIKINVNLITFSIILFPKQGYILFITKVGYYIFRSK